MFNIRGYEWIIILVIILLIFGPSKIPSLAKSVGKAISEFKKGIKETKEETDNISSDAAKTEEEVKKV